MLLDSILPSEIWEFSSKRLRDLVVCYEYKINIYIYTYIDYKNENINFINSTNI